MLLGAILPSLNLMDRWVSLLSRTKQRTVLYPKRFAAGMGGSMLVGAGAAGWASLTTSAFVLVGLTIAAASLQAVFNLCIGCWIYNGMVALTPKSGRRGEANVG